MSRITLISYFRPSELNKVKKIVNSDFKTCKVPYGIDDEHRFEIDNLPFHFTIFATDKEKQEDLVEIIKTIDIKKIKIKINRVEIMPGRNGSYVLYLGIEDNRELKELQRTFYKKFKDERYNPDNFVFHLTLHIDKDYEKILLLQNKILKVFQPFYLEFDEMCLYDYPGERIATFR